MIRSWEDSHCLQMPSCTPDGALPHSLPPTKLSICPLKCLMSATRSTGNSCILSYHIVGESLLNSDSSFLTLPGRLSQIASCSQTFQCDNQASFLCCLLLKSSFLLSSLTLSQLEDRSKWALTSLFLRNEVFFPFL